MLPSSDHEFYPLEEGKCRPVFSSLASLDGNVDMEGYPDEYPLDQEEEEANDWCGCFKKNDTSCKTLIKKTCLACIGLFGIVFMLMIFFGIKIHL